MATEWLDDETGPDGVRVSFAVEPSVERLVRERDAWTVGRLSYVPDRYRLRNLWPGFVQRKLLHDGWALVIEADSGERLRRVRPTREAALELAQDARARVRQGGVVALSGLPD